ncbi:MAG: hypothetical protein KDE50_18650 [Caldilineaceae bacterium]|nr:hypothetical protein [Caldilineaceae bacterium]MCB0141930.1 hypothetical protein [Caldilineaceae bacterium]
MRKSPFAFSNRYIGPTTRASLYVPTSAEKDNRLVYSELVDHRGFKEELNQLWWPWKCGGQSSGEGGAAAALVQLPFDHYGVGFANCVHHADGTTEFGCGDLARGIIDAFYDATRGEPISLAKHGMPEAQYQKYLTELADHGSFPDWVDFYTVGSDVFVNVIFRPTNGVSWIARHNLSASEYQSFYNDNVHNGPYKLKQVDSYVKGGQITYAVTLVKGSSANMPAYHGVTADHHQELIEQLTDQGFVPVNMSVASVRGQRFYTAFYAKKQTGGFVARSFLTADGYQQLVDEQLDAKREIAYVKSYNHNNEIRYSAIFVQNIDRSQVLKHGMDPVAYQHEFDEWVGKGYGLQMVSGAVSGDNHRYVAVWQK